jgi:hypothetical protein
MGVAWLAGRCKFCLAAEENQCLSATFRGETTTARKAFLTCGTASTLLYFAMDVVASLLYDGSSYTDQAISELSAVGAPPRSFWISFGMGCLLRPLLFFS